MQTTESSWGFIPFVVIFSSVATIIIMYIHHKHKEKMELIKKGDEVIYEDIVEQMKLNNLGRGIIFISIALGVFIGHLVVSLTSLHQGVGYIGSVLLFFGIGSLVFYFILRNK